MAGLALRARLQRGRPMISINEEDALKRILRHHSVVPTREVVNDLGALIEWVREDERFKSDFGRGSRFSLPLFMLLSKLGIYGREAIDKVRESA